MAEWSAMWGPATKIIDEVIREHAALENWDRAGFTLPMAIANALRGAGYLDSDDIWTEDSPLRKPRTPPPLTFVEKMRPLYDEKTQDPG